MQITFICNVLLWRLTVRIKSVTFRFQSTTLLLRKNRHPYLPFLFEGRKQPAPLLTQVMQWTGDSSKLVSELLLCFR